MMVVVLPSCLRAIFPEGGWTCSGSYEACVLMDSRANKQSASSLVAAAASLLASKRHSISRCWLAVTLQHRCG